MDTSSRTTGLDFVGGETPFEIIVELMRGVGEDVASRDRIALAISFSHGENAWVSETAWQAAQRGLHVKREATEGGTSRVDLEVAGTAVEFKATFPAWALDPKRATERETCLSKDIDKLMACRSPAVVIVSIAALTMGVAHQRKAFRVDYGDSRHRDLSPTAILEEGITAADNVLQQRCAQVQRVDLNPVTVPPNGGSVLPAALVGAVNLQAARI